MIMENIDGRNLEIELHKITQISILDIELSNKIYSYISKYFNDKKYNIHNDKSNENNQKITTNNFEDLSKRRYSCISINNFEDIDKILENKKDSILMKYNKKKMENLDIVKEIEELEYKYNIILDKLKSTYSENSLIKLNELKVNIEDILQKNIVPYIEVQETVYKKIYQLINILIDFEYEENVILFLHNVDTYLTEEEYKKIESIVREQKNIKMIMSSKCKNYFDYKRVEEIIFLYKGNIEYLPDIEIMLTKVNKCINKNVEISSDELLEFLKIKSFNIIKREYKEDTNTKLIYEALLEKEKNYNFDIIDMEKTIII